MYHPQILRIYQKIEITINIVLIYEAYQSIMGGRTTLVHLTLLFGLQNYLLERECVEMPRMRFVLYRHIMHNKEA